MSGSKDTGDDFASRFLSGRELYGEELTETQVEHWFESEREGYANLGSSAGAYGYEALNRRHGFNHIRGPFHRALGFGSGPGEELRPIAAQTESFTIVEPSKRWHANELFGKPAEYVFPRADGRLPFPDGNFDLVTCFGVLHHLPKVSAAIAELARCAKVGAPLLIREPIISMGDWRKKRAGITPNERGIPKSLLINLLRQNNLDVERAALCAFPLTRRLSPFGRPAFSSNLLVRIDSALSNIFAWNYRYHATKWDEKLRPTSIFVVCRKRE